MTYDEWRLSGPDEHPWPEMTECAQCNGTGTHLVDEHDTDDTRCHVCGGSGEVPVGREEPDGDYEYERRRDAAMDRG